MSLQRKLVKFSSFNHTTTSKSKLSEAQNFIRKPKRKQSFQTNLKKLTLVDELMKATTKKGSSRNSVCLEYHIYFLTSVKNVIVILRNGKRVMNGCYEIQILNQDSSRVMNKNPELYQRLKKTLKVCSKKHKKALWFQKLKNTFRCCFSQMEYFRQVFRSLERNFSRFHNHDLLTNRLESNSIIAQLHLTLNKEKTTKTQSLLNRTLLVCDNLQKNLKFLENIELRLYSKKFRLLCK